METGMLVWRKPLHYCWTSVQRLTVMLSSPVFYACSVWLKVWMYAQNRPYAVQTLPGFVHVKWIFKFSQPVCYCSWC